MKILITVFAIFAFIILIQSSSCNSFEISNLSVEEIEALYNSKSCAERDNTIIPCSWYADISSPMPALIAGLLDGAYVTGESIGDLAILTWSYAHDAEYRRQLNEMAALMWENRWEVYQELKTTVKDYGLSLVGYEGVLEAEYQYGDNILKNNFEDVKLLLDKEWKSSGKLWKDFIKDYDAHHVIPVEMLEKSEGLIFYYNNGGKFNFNSIENGIFVKKVAKGGEHAYHPKYNEAIKENLRIIYFDAVNNTDNISLQVKQIEKELRRLISKTKATITDECKYRNKRINEIEL